MTGAMSQSGPATGFSNVKVPSGSAPEIGRAEMLEPDDTTQLLRIPGLFRRWELALVLQSGIDYRIEDAGETRDGSPLVAVYRCSPEEDG